jgi:glycosyltransferase involved in cell wall biosynthesis
MKKIRVVHVITKLELGGAQRNTILTCENLDRRKFDVFLFSGQGGILLPDRGIMNRGRPDQEDRFVFVRDLVRQINPARDLKALKFLRSEFERLKPHIVHTHSSKAGIIGRIAAKKAGVPVTVHSVHGFAFSPHQSFPRRMVYQMIEKAGARYTDHYIFVSRADITTARKLNLLRKAAYSLIRSGFDFGRFSTVEKKTPLFREMYGIDPNDFVCGTIAPFKPQKGLFDLVQVASEVLEKDRRVVFFLAGDGELRKDLETELERRGIRDRFVMPGFIHDIENVIPGFDLGVSTALWEGLPQSLVQLRLMKKAAVVSDIPGNAEVIRNGENGYTVQPRDHTLFAERILFLKNNRDVLERLSHAGDDLDAWRADVMVKAQEDLYLSFPSSGQKNI